MFSASNMPALLPEGATPRITDGLTREALQPLAGKGRQRAVAPRGRAAERGRLRRTSQGAARLRDALPRGHDELGSGLELACVRALIQTPARRTVRRARFPHTWRDPR